MISSFRKYFKFILPIMILIIVIGLVFSRVYQPETGIPEPEMRISANEAKDHIGKAAEVCGDVANARFISNIEGQPTFINFGLPDPNQDFTAVIWGINRSKWNQPPENIYSGNEVCVLGSIKSHEGTPQIEVESPDQINLK
ncbi:DNA-binding protein [Gracilimonas sp. Q87]|uniref:DNA-binding protein n=1 Tax=Gracilimonas sp. Q87 TaxID=3384766 RepID=UPI003983FBA3